MFTACRDAGVDWITYRRGKPVAPRALPVRATLTRGGAVVEVSFIDEAVAIDDYGTARQITLFEHGQPAQLDKDIAAAKTALKTIPAKLPANQVNPDAKRAIHRAGRRGLQMVLRLLAANAEHWLAHHLNAYLQDPDEYRATTRNLLHLSGTITYHPDTIHVELDPPATPRLTRALTLLLHEINNTQPHVPGDPRPITYTIKQP